MLEHLATSIFAFASTNIDDLFILMLFFGDRRLRASHVVKGQYVGILALVLTSFILSYMSSIFGPRSVGVLGFFPIYLAIRQIIRLIRNRSVDNPAEAEGPALKTFGILAVAGVTIANGADNIGVYVPLLATMTTLQKIQLVFIFLVMTGGWCALAQYLATRPLIARQLSRYGHILTPVVLLVLGIYILIESNFFSLN